MARRGRARSVEAGDLLYVLDSSEAEDELLEYEVELDDGV